MIEKEKKRKTNELALDVNCTFLNASRSPIFAPSSCFFQLNRYLILDPPLPKKINNDNNKEITCLANVMTLNLEKLLIIFDSILIWTQPRNFDPKEN